MRRQELHPRTAVINKTQRNNSKKARNDALLWLAKVFPHVFDNTLCIRPLKVGIMNDILIHAEQAEKDGISKSKLREAVVLFTRRIDYLTCLKARETRIDLEGNPVSQVTEDEAERASSKIKKRVEKSARNARKAAPVKTPSQYTSRSSSSSSPEFIAHYPDRQPAFSAQTAAAPRSAPVVTHKSTRQFDPDAVARLKEKLGLSRHAKAEKETAE